ncbi:MAG TPA: T9SS type A sorting domain-containing protein [Ignavibacteriaceae bacterium]|nr:T9SS type A sorting domain-containing protein [Ignavibacteriaceae bacterium]
MRSLTACILILITCLSVKAQPQLEIYPPEMEFTDIFHRLENAYFINVGDQPLSIDSIRYNNTFYFVRFNINWRYPFVIQPQDTVRMDCILAGYFNYIYNDTRDTLIIYNNGIDPAGRLSIKIDYYEDQYYTGTIQGNVSSGGLPVPNAIIYFLWGGNFVIDKTTSDNNGDYSMQLPVGNYSVASEKDSFYTSFYDQQFDPLSATQVFVDTNGITSVNLNLIRKTTTQNSISGKIYDSTSTYPLNRGIVIVRSGTHTPDKIQNIKANTPAVNGSYAAFIDADGSFTVNDIIDPGYYYIQSFSDYFVPSYYDTTGYYPSFWQNTDSIFIGSPMNNINVYMPSDSSFGGGVISGMLRFTGNPDSGITDAIVYAQSAENNLITYALSQNNGNFRENFLPYGTYHLRAQKIGYEDALSGDIVIDSLTTNASNIFLYFQATNSVPDETFMPDKVELYQNYPNPFNPSTTVEFYLPSGKNVNLRIFNVLGETVATLYNGYLNSGQYKMRFDGSGFGSGVYFVSLTTDRTSLVRKILLLK